MLGVVCVQAALFAKFARVRKKLNDAVIAVYSDRRWDELVLQNFFYIMRDLKFAKKRLALVVYYLFRL